MKVTHNIFNMGLGQEAGGGKEFGLEMDGRREPDMACGCLNLMCDNHEVLAG